MPVDFDSGLPVATVDLGDGGAHDPQIRFAAVDSSCLWEGFPIEIRATPFSASVPSSAVSSVQIVDPLILPPSSTSALTDWPALIVPDYLEGILNGYKLQIQVQGIFSTPGSFGSVRISNEATGLNFSHTTTSGYDSGVIDLPLPPNCAQMASLGHPWLKLTPTLSNGSLGASWTFRGWRFATSWASSTGTPPSFEPRQTFFVGYAPPGSLTPGLFIDLEVNSCGVPTKTYTNVKDSLNALGLPITAAILGGHGSDIALPDSGALAGSECSGGIHEKTARPL